MVRTTLESGEEKVPEALWEGIMTTLAAEKAPCCKKRSGWWWAMAAGVAVAASIVSAVIFLHPVQIPVTPQYSIPESSPVQVPVSEGNIVAQSDVFAPVVKAVPAVAQHENEVQVEVESSPVIAPADTAVLLASNENKPAATEPEVVVSRSFQTNSEDVEFPQERKSGNSYISSIQFSINGNAGNNMGENSLPAGRRAAPTIDFPTGESLSEKENTYYGLPLTVGLGVKFNLKGRWAVGVGLNYTFLDRRFKANYNSGAVETFEYTVSNTQHYIGIPVNLYYNFAMPDRFKFYAFAGAAFEKNVGCKYSFDNDGSPKILTQKVGGIQSSANIGLGIQFSLTDYLCLYLDPSFRYFFPASSQPRSVRTVQPCQINCEFGLRFEL